jgi:MOSC domain-containing protein YiiM
MKTEPTRVPIGEEAATMLHRTTEELAAGLDEVRLAPRDRGTVTLIAARPAHDQRAVLQEADLDEAEGLVGDDWRARGRSRTPDGSADPERQLTLMNARIAALIAGPLERWALAGDQIYVDFDLAEAALPAGTRLRLGTAVIEISAAPHTGCSLFADRFGADARAFVNTVDGRALRLRGVNARIVTGGTVRVGDEIVVEQPA